jgi:hypothetical protein
MITSKNRCRALSNGAATLTKIMNRREQMEEVYPVNLTEGEMVDILASLEKRIEVVRHSSVAQRLRRLHDRLERIFEQRDELEESEQNG